jgi:hypothetical protein
MNKKAKLICLFAVSGLFYANNATAFSVVVNGDLLYSTSTGALNVSLVPGASLPNSCPADTLPQSIPVTGAAGNSDIAFSGLNVFVKTGGTVATVTIPSCLAEAASVGECGAFVDAMTGNLTIPCVEYQGTIYHAELVQRGSSSNWELISASPNVKFR